MSEWDRRIREHPVFEAMNALGPAIDGAFAALNQASGDAFAGLERIRAILTFCGKRIAAADPMIATPEPLSTIEVAFTGARTELEQFVSDQNIGHITNANADCDRALAAVNQLPAVQSPEEMGAVIPIVTTYRDVIEKSMASAAGILESFRSRTERIETGLTELRSNLDAEQQRLSQVTTDYQRQFSEAQEKRNLESSEALRQAQLDLGKVVSDYQAQFSTAQDSRSTEFTSAQTARQQEFHTLTSEYSQRLADQNAEFTVQREEIRKTQEAELSVLSKEYVDRASAFLDAIEREKARIEKLVGVIGNLGVTSGYLRNANQARYAMWGWQVLTVAAMVAVSWVASVTLPILEDSAGHFNWGLFAGRVLLLGSLGVIAAYAASQADKLFEAEKRNRKLALELEAIGPFLAPLPEEAQNKFRIEMGERSFGREDTAVVIHGKSPATLVDLLRCKESKEVLDLVADFIKKAK